MFKYNKLQYIAILLGTTALPARSVAQMGIPIGGALSGSLGWAVVNGADHAGLTGSPSFEAVARYTTPWRIQLAGMAHYSRYPISGTNEKLNLITFLAESRIQILPSTAALVPYLGVRIGRVWETLRARGADLTNIGMSLGGSVGFEFAVGEQVGLEFGGSIDHMSFGEFEVDGSTAWASCLRDTVPPGSSMIATIQTCVPFVNRVLAQVGAGPGGTRESISQPGSETTGNRIGLWFRLTLYLRRR